MNTNLPYLSQYSRCFIPKPPAADEIEMWKYSKWPTRPVIPYGLWKWMTICHKKFTGMYSKQRISLPNQNQYTVVMDNVYALCRNREPSIMQHVEDNWIYELNVKDHSRWVHRGICSYNRDTTITRRNWIIITRVSEVIMFSPCVFVTLFVCLFVSLSRCLSGRFNYEGLVPHKQYFAGTLLGMSSCASYDSRTHDVIDDVTRSQRRSNFESDISPSIFKLERRSKTQNVGNDHGYLSGLFNFRYNFR